MVEVLHQRVWLWDGNEPNARCWSLIVRKDKADNKVKYSLSNAAKETSLERLVYMQAQRYLVERVFQDAKNQCGMGDYQARGWRSWYHHMAIIMMAMLFMLEQRLKNKDDLPLLSCADIAAVLKHILPHRAVIANFI